MVRDQDVPFASGGHHRRVDGKRHLGDNLTHQTLVPTPDGDVRGTREGRIAKLLAQQARFRGSAIMRGCGTYGRMLGPVGLDDNVPTACRHDLPSRSLLEQLEGSLGCAKKIGRKLERRIGVGDADERHVEK